MDQPHGTSVKGSGDTKREFGRSCHHGYITFLAQELIPIEERVGKRVGGPDPPREYMKTKISD